MDEAPWDLSSETRSAGAISPTLLPTERAMHHEDDDDRAYREHIASQDAPYIYVINALLSTMSGEQQQIVSRFISGERKADIAADTGVRRQTVGEHWRRATRKFDRILEGAEVFSVYIASGRALPKSTKTPWAAFFLQTVLNLSPRCREVLLWHCVGVTGYRRVAIATGLKPYTSREYARRIADEMHSVAGEMGDGSFPLKWQRYLRSKKPDLRRLGLTVNQTVELLQIVAGAHLHSARAKERSAACIVSAPTPARGSRVILVGGVEVPEHKQLSDALDKIVSHE